jgi:hypothetical protein
MTNEFLEMANQKDNEHVEDFLQTNEEFKVELEKLKNAFIDLQKAVENFNADQQALVTELEQLERMREVRINYDYAAGGWYLQ